MTRGGLIGVDVGGTHTDVIVVNDGRVARGKSLTTYDDFATGVLSAVEIAAITLGMSLKEALGATDVVVNATTVVTNAIAQLQGSRVGVLVTAGFRDTFQLAGGPRLNVYDDHLQTNVPSLVPRGAILEIEERVTADGDVLIPIHEEECEAAIAELIDGRGVEAVAVCFLQSHANPVHEVAVERLVRAAYPDCFVSLSHAVYAVRGENRRWNTAVLNAFVQGHARAYASTMEDRLSQAGLDGKLVFFQGLGGCITKEQAAKHPLSLLRAGPAGGVIGASELARRLGHKHFILADMGGTSLEASLIDAEQPRIASKVDIGRWRTGARLVDVASIGAGGGSIAWVSERGAPQVGPQSAGSTPGPAAYGRGGDAPTVTDAMVALGFIDPDNYLGGREILDKGLAEKAIASGFGDRLGLSLEDAACAIHNLVVANMSGMIREVTVDRGHDPRGLSIIGFGGMFGLFAGALAKRLGVTEVVLPQNASAFSAWGLLVADFVVRKDRSVDWTLDDSSTLDELNAVGELMVAEARSEIGAAGFEGEGLAIRRSIAFRFKGQSHELAVPIPDRALARGDVPALRDAFLHVYGSTYGLGAVWEDAPIVAVEYTVTAVGLTEKPSYPERQEPVVSEPADESAGRLVYLPEARAWKTVPVYLDGLVERGATITGPAIVDASDATVFVPDGMELARDGIQNLVLREDLKARAA